jgi:toxin ParE1/3/4
MNLPVHPEAMEEFLTALERFNDESVAKGTSFGEEIERTAERIRLDPRFFPLAGDAPRRSEVRHAVLQAFPYRIVYAELGGKVVILAIAHLRRKPGYWRRRLRDSN